MKESKDETRPDDSLPRKARPIDEKFAFGWKTRHQAEAKRAHGTHPIGWRERPAKQRVVRIDGAGRPPEECQRYDHSQVCQRPSAPGRLSPGLNVCATSRSTENSFAESAAATCPWRIHKLRCNRRLVQPSTVLLPSVGT